jgi:hypothetical protein
VNGPEHWREAERLLELAVSNRDVHKPSVYQRAQVHATLALAAATVANIPKGGRETAWSEVLR